MENDHKLKLHFLSNNSFFIFIDKGILHQVLILRILIFGSSSLNLILSVSKNHLLIHLDVYEFDLLSNFILLFFLFMLFIHLLCMFSQYFLVNCLFYGLEALMANMMESLVSIWLVQDDSETLQKIFLMQQQQRLVNQNESFTSYRLDIKDFIYPFAW